MSLLFTYLKSKDGPLKFSEQWKKSQVFNGQTKNILDLINFMLVGKGEQKYERFSRDPVSRYDGNSCLPSCPHGLSL